MNAAKAAFAEYLNDTNLDSRQIYFVNQIIEYIVQNGLMKDLSVLRESPFTDQGSVVALFPDHTVLMGILKIIEKVNANALASGNLFLHSRYLHSYKNPNLKAIGKRFGLTVRGGFVFRYLSSSSKLCLFLIR